MKRILIAFLLSVLFYLPWVTSELRAAELRLIAGGSIEVDEVWEREGEIWYRQGQIIRSLPRSQVVLPLPHISPPTTQSAKHPSGLNVSPKGREFFIVRLKDGSEFEADSVEVNQATIRYRVGTMQALVEKPEVLRVVRLVTSAVPAEKQAISREFTTGSQKLDGFIFGEAKRNRLDPLLIYLIMRQESGFRTKAVSRAGARGLMQLMPQTAKQFGVENIYDPEQNIAGAARFLRSLLDRYDGDINLTLAAYNAGEDAVSRYGNRVPGFRETVGYVRKIGWAYYYARNPRRCEYQQEKSCIQTQSR